MLDAILAWAMLLLPYAIVFFVGALFIPGIILFFGNSYPLFPQTTGRILWTMGALSKSTTIALQRDNHRYEMLAADQGEFWGEQYYKVQPEGADEPLYIKGSNVDLYRLGKRPFGIVAEKTDRMMRQFGAEDDMKELPDPGHIDGTERQGYPGFNHLQDVVDWVLPLRRHESTLLDSGGSGIIDRAEAEALREHGGNEQLSPLMTAVAAILALLLGAGMVIVSLVVMP